MKKAVFWVSFIGAIIILCFSLFFKINDLTSSGASTGRVGLPGSTVILNANSLFNIGTIILILSFLNRFNKKKHDEEMEYLENTVYKQKDIKKKKKRKSRISK